VRFEGGRWKARLTLDGRERLVPIEPPLLLASDRDKALQEAHELAKLARGAFDTRARASELVEDWYDRWLAFRREKGKRIKSPQSHLTIHILPILRGKPMAEVSRSDLEQIVQELDAKVCEGKLRWKSASNVWGTVTKSFDDAHRGKTLELRVRDDNPAKEVRGPDRGVETEKVHLYPSEFLTLVSSAAVPLFRRRYYAIGVYIYLRPAELEALRWEDVDLERETVQIRRGIDRERKVEKAPKAGRARAPFDLEPALLPLLKAMHAEVGGRGNVVGRLGDERELAGVLRRDLLDAGITRRELHEGSNDPPREWMTLHDLRTTGITWMAVQGQRPPFEIMARAGHRQLAQTQGYIDRASLIRRGYGQTFPTLPTSLLEQPQCFPETFPEESSNSSTKVAEAHGNRTHRPPREGRAHRF